MLDEARPRRPESHPVVPRQLEVPRCSAPRPPHDLAVCQWTLVSTEHNRVGARNWSGWDLSCTCSKHGETVHG